MASAFDELIDQLLHDVALSGPSGFGEDDLAEAIKKIQQSQNTSTNNSNVPTTPLDLLFADEPPPTAIPIVDDAFVKQVWDWLAEYPDINIIQSPNNDQAYDQNATDGQKRLAATNDRVWHAITGHGIDHKRVQPLEFVILSVIAAHGPQGIVQPDIVRLTGQDKRSVPKRTDSLAKKGYITKEAVIAHSSKTSLLKLKRYVSKPSNEAFAVDNQGNQARIIHYDVWYDETMRLLQENNNIMVLEDLRKGLSISNKKWETRAYFRCIRRLARVGCIRRVQAKIDSNNGAGADEAGKKPKYLRCVQLRHSPTEADRGAFIGYEGTSRKPFVDEDSGDDEDAEFVPDDEMEGFGEDALDDQTQDPDALSARWTQDLSLLHQVFRIVEQAGQKGITSVEIIEMLGGSNFRRPLDEIITRLSDMWHVSQPPHLRHLGVIRDVVSIGKRNIFRLRSRPNFEKAVAAGEASWDAIHDYRRSDIKRGKKQNTIPSEQPPDLDEWGFPKIPAHNFAVEGRVAPLAECVSLLQDKGRKKPAKVVKPSVAGKRKKKTPRAGQAETIDTKRLARLSKNPMEKTYGRPKGETSIHKSKTKSSDGQSTLQSPKKKPAAKAKAGGIRRTYKMEEEDLANFKASVRLIALRLIRAEELAALQQNPSASRTSPIVFIPADETAEVLGIRKRKAEEPTEGQPANKRGRTKSSPAADKKRKAIESTESAPPKKRGRPTKAMLLERERLDQEQFEQKRIDQERQEHERLELERRKKELSKQEKKFEECLGREGLERQRILSLTYDTMPIEMKGRFETIEHDMLHRIRPGVYIQPPGTRSLKMDILVASGQRDRRGILPKTKILVIKSSNLANLDWFQGCPDEVEPQYRHLPDNNGNWHFGKALPKPSSDDTDGTEGEDVGQDCDRDESCNTIAAPTPVLNQPKPVEKLAPKAADWHEENEKGSPASPGLINADARRKSPQSIAHTQTLETPKKVESSASASASQLQEYLPSIYAHTASSGPALHDASFNKSPIRESSPKTQTLNVTMDALNIASHISSVEYEIQESIEGNDGTQSNSNEEKQNHTASEVDVDHASSPDMQARASVQVPPSLVGVLDPALTTNSDEAQAPNHPRRTSTPGGTQKVGLEDTEDQDYTDTEQIQPADITPEMFFLGFAPRHDPEGLGLVEVQRANAVMDIMKACDGVYPGTREMWYPLVTAWQKLHKRRLDRHTAARVVSTLLAQGKLQQYIFKWKAKSGTPVEIRIVTLPGIPVDDLRVRRAKHGFKSKYPAKYLPAECDVDPDLRVKAENFRMPFWSRPKEAQPISFVNRDDPDKKKFGSYKEEFPVDNNVSVRRPSFADLPPPIPRAVGRSGGRPRKNPIPAAVVQSNNRILDDKYAGTDDDDSEIDEEQAEMQGEFQLLDYSHDPDSRFERANAKGKLSRYFRLDDTIGSSHDYLARIHKLSSARSDPLSLVAMRRGLDRAKNFYPQTLYPKPVQQPQIMQQSNQGQSTAPRSMIDPSLAGQHNVQSATLLSGSHKVIRHRPQLSFENTFSQDFPKSLEPDCSQDNTSRRESAHFFETSGTFADRGLPAFNEDAKRLRSKLSKLSTHTASDVTATTDKMEMPSSLEDILERDPVQRRATARHTPGDHARFCQEVDRIQAWELHIVNNNVSMAKQQSWNFIVQSPEGPHVRPADKFAVANTRNEMQTPDPIQIRSRHPVSDPIAGSLNSQSVRTEQNLVPYTAGLDPERNTSILKRKANFPDVEVTTDGRQGTVNGPPAKKPARKVAFKPRRRDPFHDSDRLIAAVALVGAICGGIQQYVNWAIVDHALGFKHGADYLESKWRWMHHKRGSEMRNLQNAILEPFLEAYEEGSLPKLDFTKPETTDWPAILRWVEHEIVPNYQTSKDTDLPTLPNSRQELELEYTITEPEKMYEIGRDSYFTQSFDSHRGKLAHGYIYADGLPEDEASRTKRSDVLNLAKSWIKANCSTKQYRYNQHKAAEKLKILGNSTNKALTELIREGILIQEKPHRQLPGRNFHYGSSFLKTFQRWPRNSFDIPERFYLRDVAGAWYAITRYLNEHESYTMSAIVRDSEMIVLTSLFGAGMIRPHTHLPERNDDWRAPWPKITSLSYTEGKYDAKRIERARLRFPLTILKTPTFTIHHNLKPGVPIPLIPRLIGQEPFPRLPFWTDIHEGLVDDHWDMVLRSIMHLVVFRPGATAGTMAVSHDGKLGEWEIEMVLDWMEKTGIIQRFGAGQEEDGVWKGGWKTTEWWPATFSPEIATWQPPQA